MENWRRISTTLVILSLSVTTARGYNFYQDSIPNGNKVPHPCIEGATWHGVGHEAAGGGGVRNKFGIAFAANGKVWNRTLCEADSDGDGVSNGKELGDPDCRWTPGSTPDRVDGITHPGICDPYDSIQCRPHTGFVKCEGFKCKGIEDPDTIVHTVRIPETAVPPQETTYQCMPFAMPADSEYHMVAYTPNVTNWNVLHHIVIYGCNDAASISDDELGKTYNCFMGQRNGCNEFLAVWALGIDGYCFHDWTGLRMGLKGYTRAILELHWTNPFKSSQYTDSSGINFYLTKKIRAYDAGVLMMGEQRMFIPPGKVGYDVHGRCDAECTLKYMQGGIQIFSVINHMHKLGQSVISTVVRNTAGTSVSRTLGYDATYDYNKPVIHQLKETITVKPGDQLEITCIYNSTLRNTTTRFGIGTNDEMCYAFLFYWPAQNLPIQKCVSYGIVGACDLEDFDEDPVINGCDFANVFNRNNPEVQELINTVQKLCSAYYCFEECKQYVKNLFETEPCLNEVNRPYVKESVFLSTIYQVENRNLWALLESCNAEIAKESVVPQECEDDVNAGTSVMFSGLFTALLLCVACFF